MDWLTAVLTIGDWLITQSEAQGETIPPDVLEARTALRRRIVEQAAEEATNSGDSQ